MFKGREMVKWTLYFTKQAQKDAKKLSASNPQQLLEVISENPFKTPPPFERLIGDLDGALSRRINIHNRIVYQVLQKEHAVKILRMWTHYQ
jgi:Txe/YoeB family toxin of toxin-antitoxin system